MEQAGKQRATSESAEQKRAVLTVQVLWGCQAYNATSAEAARTVVADLYEQLSKGGTVTVHIEDADGKEYTHLVSVIGTAVRFVLNDGELIDSGPVVVFQVIEINQLDQIAGNGGVVSAVFHGDAFHQHLVKASIVL